MLARCLCQIQVNHYFNNSHLCICCNCTIVIVIDLNKAAVFFPEYKIIIPSLRSGKTLVRIEFSNLCAKSVWPGIHPKPHFASQINVITTTPHHHHHHHHHQHHHHFGSQINAITTTTIITLALPTTSPLKFSYIGEKLRSLKSWLGLPAYFFWSRRVFFLGQMENEVNSGFCCHLCLLSTGRLLFIHYVHVPIVQLCPDLVWLWIFTVVVSSVIILPKCSPHHPSPALDFIFANSLQQTGGRREGCDPISICISWIFQCTPDPFHSQSSSPSSPSPTSSTSSISSTSSTSSPSFSNLHASSSYVKTCKHPQRPVRRW